MLFFRLTIKTYPHLQCRSEFGCWPSPGIWPSSAGQGACTSSVCRGNETIQDGAAVLFHSFVLFMAHSKTQIDTTDTSSPPNLSVGSLACLWHAGLFDTRLITARRLVINQGQVERDSRGPPVFQTITPLSPISHFKWPVLQVQDWGKGFSFRIN